MNARSEVREARAVADALSGGEWLTLADLHDRTGLDSGRLIPALGRLRAERRDVVVPGIPFARSEFRLPEAQR